LDFGTVPTVGYCWYPANWTYIAVQYWCCHASISRTIVIGCIES